MRFHLECVFFLKIDIYILDIYVARYANKPFRYLMFMIVERRCSSCAWLGQIGTHLRSISNLKKRARMDLREENIENIFLSIAKHLAELY